MHYTRRFPPHLHDDLTQAGLEGLTVAARQFDPSRSIPFWLFARGIVVRFVIREAKRSLKEEADHLSLESPSPADPELRLGDQLAGPSNPEHLLEALRQRRLEGAALSRLPERNRLALSARLRGDSFARIASEAGVSERTIRRRCAAALILLRLPQRPLP